MAVKNEGKPESVASTNTYGAEQSGQSSQSSQGGRSVMNLNSLLRRPISRSSAGEAVSKYGEALRQILKAETQDVDGEPLKLLVLDNNIDMVALSSLLVCHHQAQGGVEHVGVYTLIVEGSGSRLTKKVVNIAGQQVEVTAVAGDVYDSFYWQKVQKKVHETFGSRARVHDAGVLVIPSELSADDTGRLRSILFNATSALYTVMDNALGNREERFSVGMISGRDNMSARLDYGTNNDESAVGMPVRSDITVKLQGVASAGGQGQYEQAMDVTKVTGFIDLVYDANSAQAPAQTINPWAIQQPVATQKYFPRFVITDVDSEVNAITMELQLLALSTATLLSKNMAWAGAFHPNYNARNPDLRDIGAIGYEFNVTGDPNAEPDRIDTKSDSFSRENLYQLIGMAIHDGLIYSMDVEETGELSWINGTFAAAANNDADARNLIIEAANNLTNHNFGRIFGSGEAIAVDDFNRIHLGYYVDQDGNRRDVREIDYLAMLNLVGGKDTQTAIDFADTYDRTDIPLEIRLERRERIMQSVLGDSLRIKGYGRRITFNPKFIMALEEACAAAGLIVRPANVLQDFSKLGIRGSLSAANFAVRGFQGGMFQGPQAPFANYRAQPGLFGRWGR